MQKYLNHVRHIHEATQLVDAKSNDRPSVAALNHPLEELLALGGKQAVTRTKHIADAKAKTIRESEDFSLKSNLTLPIGGRRGGSNWTRLVRRVLAVIDQVRLSGVG